MSGTCCSHAGTVKYAHQSLRFRRALWVALIINAVMFGVELVGGLRAGSVSLLADAVDFFGDAANYGISLLVLGMTLNWRARAALFKGLAMGALGIFVLGRAAWWATADTVPEPVTMGAIGAVAPLVNVSVALMRYAWREGDANMRSVWLCSRNAAISKLTVMAAALGVFGTGSAWPDLVVASVILETAVGHARVGRHGVGWVGARTRQAHACKDEQRPQRAPERLNRVRSALTKRVSSVVAKNISIHAALQRSTAVSGVVGVLALIAARSVIQQARAELHRIPTHA